MGGETEPTNSLGFIPAVEIFNYMDCTGESQGNGEFNWLAHQIMYHDELVRNVRKNMKFFGNQHSFPVVLSTTLSKVVKRTHLDPLSALKLALHLLAHLAVGAALVLASRLVPVLTVKSKYLASLQTLSQLTVSVI